MVIGGIKLITKKQYDAICDKAFDLKIANDNLEGINKLLNERIDLLEKRNKDLIRENDRLKEVKHE